METLKCINSYLGEFDNIIGALGLIVSIIGIVVGVIGGKEIHTANKLKVKVGDIETKIKKIEFNNSQIAQNITNNGLTYRDAKELAEDVVSENSKNKPDEIISDTEPMNQKTDDYWLQDY